MRACHGLIRVCAARLLHIELSSIVHVFITITRALSAVTGDFWHAVNVHSTSGESFGIHVPADDAMRKRRIAEQQALDALFRLPDVEVQ